MKRYPAVLIALISAVTVSATAFAQVSREDRDLIFTYIGPSVSGGFNHIEHSDWFFISRSTRKYGGYFLSGGVLLAVYGKFLAGDFNLHFTHNQNDMFPLYHLTFAMSGRGVVPIGRVIEFTPGIGLYLETPPSNEKYNSGGGGHLPVGFTVKTSFDTKLIFDAYVRYGFFGLGEESKKFSYGIQLGFLFKIGRI